MVRIEKLSDSRLKITLYISDMHKWNITFDNLLPSEPGTSDFFRKILSVAERQTGIKLENCRLIVETIRESDTTCVMIITKKTAHEKKFGKAALLKKQQLEKDEKLVFVFEKIDDILLFAKNNLYYCFLFDGKNTLYRYRDLLMVSVSLADELAHFSELLCDKLCEYADVIKDPHVYTAYLEEHAKVIIRDSAFKTVYFKM